MNKEVIKTIEKAERKNTFHKWWKKNRYLVMRIVLFPVWLVSLGFDKLEEWYYSQNSWGEKRADEILSYYIPRRSEWIRNSEYFYFFDNGYGWTYGSAKRYLKLKDRIFWKCNCHNDKLRCYLLDKFELEGFYKEVLDYENGRTEIMFDLLEEN